MGHLEENTIISFVADKLSDVERRKVEEHIDTCGSCRKLLAAMGADSSLLTPYAGTLETETPAVRPSMDPVHGMMPAPGDIVANRYTIIKALGRGGMGYVFQAKDNELGIEVAVKMLRPELTRDDEQVRHLRREILAGRAIAHPNACRVFDLGKDARFYFITMEYVAGANLEDKLREGRLATPQAVEMLETVLSVLAAAHKEGIVHRDLKPANLMLDANQRIKVMDFGLARDLKGESSLVGAVGTPAYWAPEQARGEPATPAADVYAIGVIAYLMLSGAVSTQSIMKRLDRVPEQYRAWITRCLVEEPEARYADGATALAAFNVARGGRPSVFKRALIPFLALGAAAVGGGVWWATSRGGSSAPKAAPIVDPTPAVAIDAAAQPLAADAPLPLDVALDAAVVVDAAPVDAASKTRPQVRRDAGVPSRTPDACTPSPIYECPD